MATRFETHKNTRAAKRESVARRQVRTVKRTPADAKSLQTVARSLGARYVA